MNYSRKDFITPNEILADVLKSVKDEEYLHNSPGWYISQMQQALEELSFDTLFDEKTMDFKVPEDLNLEIPKGTFNLIQIYLFNGENLCSINNSQIVWHKRNYFTKGNGYLARNKADSRDPFYGNSFFDGNNRDFDNSQIDYRYKQTGKENTFYYNIHNGIIMLSPACRSFERIAIRLNGTGCAVGDAPVIPLFFRQAVKDYLCEVTLRNRMVDDPSVTGAWKIYDRNLNKNENFGFYTGSWYKAKKRISSMNDHERESLREYLAKPTW
jgi:hypothetical protein